MKISSAWELKLCNLQCIRVLLVLLSANFTIALWTSFQTLNCVPLFPLSDHPAKCTKCQEKAGDNLHRIDIYLKNQFCLAQSYKWFHGNPILSDINIKYNSNFQYEQSLRG